MPAVIPAPEPDVITTGARRPLLSICIPTFNRADLLGPSLSALCRELATTGDKAEIIVCDNASTDRTPEVLLQFQETPHVRIFRNDSNIGAARNILRLVTELARGEFIWVLGDDDLVIEGAVRRILDCMSAEPAIDYYFLNHTYKSVAERRPFGLELSSRLFADFGPTLCFHTKDEFVNRWEQIVMFTETPALFSSIVSHVARASLWSAQPIDARSTTLFDSFDTTFPHLAILAPSLVGRRVYYFGSPQVILFVGAQEWFSEHWSRLLFTHVLRIADLLSLHGATPSIVFKYRDTVFRVAGDNFRQLLRGNRSMIWKIVLVGRLLIRYHHHKSLLRLVAREMTLALRATAGRARRALSFR